MKAKTIVEISGHCIDTIPAGTIFDVITVGTHYSTCSNLGVSSVYNNEYVLLGEDDDPVSSH